MQTKYLFFILLFFNSVVFSINSDSIIIQYEANLKNTENENTKAELYFTLAELHERKNEEHISFDYYKKARELFLRLNKNDSAAKCDIEIFSLLSSQDNLNIDPLPYLKRYEKYALASEDAKKMILVYKNYGSFYMEDDVERSKLYYLKAIQLCKEKKDSHQLGVIYSNLALVLTVQNKMDSARYYLNEASSIISKDSLYNHLIILVNKANTYEKESNPKKALEYLKIADSINPSRYNKVFKKIVYQKFSNNYEKLGDYKNALFYNKKFNSLMDSLDISNQNIEISKIKEQYDNEKLRANKLQAEANSLANRNLLFATLSALVVTLIIGFLMYKNIKKKQILAEKEMLIEQQRAANLIKEQELTSINAMIKGQEQERLKIAQDLHDDLGSLMTNIRWHFDSLETYPAPDTIKNTKELLNQAYNKIRMLAHSRNSGVLAKEGLLKAVTGFVNSLREVNNLQINVIDFGLSDRLENSLEITIFRIIQELITNVIKHASATEMSIHLINHDGILNILVEDNGIGFNTNKLKSNKDGMGLLSIEKRVNTLQGTFNVESIPNKGTNIIIDIPIT